MGLGSGDGWPSKDYEHSTPIERAWWFGEYDDPNMAAAFPALVSEAGTPAVKLDDWADGLFRPLGKWLENELTGWHEHCRERDDEFTVDDADELLRHKPDCQSWCRPGCNLHQSIERKIYSAFVDEAERLWREAGGSPDEASDWESMASNLWAGCGWQPPDEAK